MTRSQPTLPPWRGVLAVAADPDDESLGPGAVLAASVDIRADVAVLCVTHGGSSTLHGVAGDLHRLRNGVDRAPQPAAAAARQPRAVDNALWRRLDLRGDAEPGPACATRIPRRSLTGRSTRSGEEDS